MERRKSHYGRCRRWLVAVGGLTVAMLSAQANEGKNVLRGRVIQLTPDKITIQAGTERVNLARPFVKNQPDAGLPKDLRVGDQVQVYYSMSVDKVERVSAGQAGEAGDDPQGERVIDDRAFYEARNHSELQRNLRQGG